MPRPPLWQRHYAQAPDDDNLFACKRCDALVVGGSRHHHLAQHGVHSFNAAGPDQDVDMAEEAAAELHDVMEVDAAVQRASP